MVMNSFEEGPPKGGAREFQTTFWTVIRKAAVKDTNAWQQLSLAYWYPLYAYIRRKGYSHADAEDRTQDFFRFLIDKNAIQKLDCDCGQFRCWLLTSCNNFLKNHYKREHAIKRGGGKKFVPIDDTAALRYEPNIATKTTPEDLYERQWAKFLLERVMAQLERECEAKGKARLFALLRPYLVGEASPGAYAQFASQTGMTEASLRETVHRLRKRYGSLLRDEVAATVSRREEVDDEIRYLMSVLARD